MSDFYTLLVKKIKDAESDPARLRELVYEATRLALKRHVNVYYPAVSLQDGKHLMNDLEAAIERLEIDSGGTVKPSPPVDDKSTSIFGTPLRPAKPAKQEFNFRAAFEGRYDEALADPPADEAEPSPLSDRGGFFDRRSDVAPAAFAPRANDQRSFAAGGDDDARPARAPRANDRPSVRRGDVSADWHYDEPDNRPGPGELVLLPTHKVPSNRNATYLVQPDTFPARHDTYDRDLPKPPGSWSRTALIAAGIVSQLGIVVLAGAAFYVSVWGRGVPLAADQDVALAPPRLPAKVRPQVVAAARPETETGDATTLAVAAATVIPPTAIAAAPAFPRPTAYGVYAISDNRLIELEQVATAPVDPRARNSLQITKASRHVIPDGKLTFIAYRRDLTTSAPDKVPVRIAARIARQMIFDPLGKTVTQPPPVETWLIRDQGYDLRVSPLRESSEMVLLRPDSEDFAFPPGRYELQLSGQSYDFVIAGTITDPAQCVEGVATARGPAFYECRAP